MQDSRTPWALLRAVARAQRWITGIYRLDLELRAEQFVVAPEAARRLLPAASPRSGMIVIDEEGGARLGLYIDPRDARDADTIIEETSHFVSLAWHASRDLPVSRLLLELQGEVDRFAVARLVGRDGLSHFHGFTWGDWMDPPTRELYALAHACARRYCRRLSQRFPTRADTPALLDELRRFYRAPPDQKLQGIS